MNSLTIIGNLTRNPELRTTTTGKQVCSFTVAVNRRRSEGQEQEADFFRVSVWNQMAEVCQKYLAKGRKVAVVGPVRLTTYTAQDGTTRANMDVLAESVEFLSPKGEGDQGQEAQTVQAQKPDNGGYVVVDTDDLPF